MSAQSRNSTGVVDEKKKHELKLVSRAWSDDNFKEELLHDPKATIERATGIRFSKNIKVQVFEETANQLYFVLPHKPAEKLAADELLDEDLDHVAGGSGEGAYFTDSCPSG